MDVHRDEARRKERKNNFIFRMHPTHFTSFLTSLSNASTPSDHVSPCIPTGTTKLDAVNETHTLFSRRQAFSASRTNRKTGSSSCLVFFPHGLFRLFVRVPCILVPAFLEPGFFVVDSDQSTPFLLSDQIQEIFCSLELEALATETLGLWRYHQYTPREVLEPRRGRG